MARPRTPTAVLELRGAFKNHPSRLKARKGEPLVSTPLPAPPSYLALPVASMWREMQARGYWLTSADCFLLEIAATYMVAYREDRLKSADTALLIGVLAKVGFTPNDRARLTVATRPESV